MTAFKRFLSTPSSPKRDPQAINPHTVFYRQFSKPFTKICLLSVGSYYGMIYLWEYLESTQKQPQESS
ncbi:uncharacterized protein LODBEIA_P01460 [Lodderomyces beijingensis]|uniref:Uncharacterized protein n=1 Tax=Lodderomyces beijingensis TaxID=1775926 RepID=A0ABP0ZCL9_9ASCO